MTAVMVYNRLVNTPSVETDVISLLMSARENGPIRINYIGITGMGKNCKSYVPIKYID